MDVRLRLVEPSDMETLFAHQLERDATRMAAFTSENPSDRAAFEAHWARILGNPEIVVRTITLAEDGAVVGHVASFMRGDEREVTYWIGRDHWGRGIATAALRLLLEEVGERPLHARAAKDNIASVRVLEKCGFRLVGYERGFANARQQEIEEAVFVLE
ncbi:MAG: GNAT family N-acetyltransferase [Phycisphaerales bacterium]